MERNADVAAPVPKESANLLTDMEKQSSHELKFAMDSVANYDLLPPSICGKAIPSFVILCAETGMGKSRFLGAAQRAANNGGFVTWLFSFGEESSSDATMHMMRLSRDIPRHAGEGNGLLVCLDDVPPSDEYEVARQAKAIRRMVQAGVHVMIAIRPEAEQLAEELWEAAVVKTTDLLYRSAGKSSLDRQAWKRTYGIGILVAAFDGDAATGVKATDLGNRYLSALEALTNALLRQGLSDEERTVRAALVLLGSGSFEELRYLSRRCDDEMLEWLQSSVPYFGIDIQARTFRCAGVSEDLAFSSIVGRVGRLGLCSETLLIRAAEILVARGDGFRATVVCGLARTESTLEALTRRWSVVFCEAGVCAPILQNMRNSGPVDLQSLRQEDYGLIAAVFLTQDRRGKNGSHWSLKKDVTVDDLCSSNMPQDNDARRALLMVASRWLMKSGKVSTCMTQLMLNGDRNLSSWYDHIEARSLMMAGRFSRAYELLADAGHRNSVRTISDAFLADDMLVAELMTGGVPDWTAWDAYQSSRSFFARSDIGRLKCYSEELVGALLAMLGYGSDRDGCIHLMTKADSSGDVALLAWASLMTAVCEQRAGATTHAHVRCRHAISLAQALGLDAVELAACFVDAVLLELLGEGGALASYLKLPKAPMQLRRLTAVVMRALGQEVPQGYERVETFFRSAYSRDYLWELSFVLTGLGDLSREVSRVTPISWLEMHRAVRSRQTDFFVREVRVGTGMSGIREEPHPTLMIPGMDQTDMRRRGTSAELTGEHAITRVRIAFFGGLRISVEGEPIPDRLLWRRKARLVLIALALARGHQLRRSQVLEEIWGESEEPGNARRIYEALSVIRKYLGDRVRGVDPIVIDRSTRSIALDPTVVSCDIDDFEREAKSVLSSDGDDETILTHANAMVSIYRNGTDIPTKDLGPLAQTRKAELETLYVDASILAAEAALRTGRPRLAVRLATQAHAVADLREDTVRVLIDALGQSGRINEVSDVYRTYSRRLIDEQGIPPSAALRHAVERIVNQGHAGTSQNLLYAEL